MTSKDFLGAAYSSQEYQDVPRLGWLFWAETGKIGQTRKEAEEIVSRYGFNPDNFPVASAKRAFRWALDDIRTMRRSRGPCVLARPVQETTDYVSYQVTVEYRKTREDGEYLEYSRKFLARMFKESESVAIFSETTEIPKFEQELQDRILVSYEYYRKHVRNWLLTEFLLSESNKWNRIAAKPSGHIWFVPDDYTDALERMEKVFEDFGHGSHLYRHPVIDTISWRKNVARMLDAELQAEISNLSEELNATVTKAVESGGQIREKTLQIRLKRFREVAKKAQAYEELLSYKAEKIRSALEDLEDSVKSILRGEDETVKAVKHIPRKTKEKAGQNKPSEQAETEQMEKGMAKQQEEQIKAPF